MDHPARPAARLVVGVIALPWGRLIAAAIVLAAGFAAGAGFEKRRTDAVQLEFAQYREAQQAATAAAAAAALRAEAEATAREHALQAQINQLDQDARHADEARIAARADADRAAERLRTAIATINYLGNSPSTSAAASDQCPADRFAELLAEADGLAERSSEAADNAIRRGLVCEAAYDAVRVELDASSAR